MRDALQVELCKRFSTCLLACLVGLCEAFISPMTCLLSAVAAADAAAASSLRYPEALVAAASLTALLLRHCTAASWLRRRCCCVRGCRCFEESTIGGIHPLRNEALAPNVGAILSCLSVCMSSVPYPARLAAVQY